MPSTPCSSASCASSAVSTPLTRIGSVVCPRSQSRSFHVRPRFGKVASIVAAAVSGSSSGVLSSFERKTGSLKYWPQPSPLDERQVRLPQVARPPAERQRVERDDDRAVAVRPRRGGRSSRRSRGRSPSRAGTSAARSSPRPLRSSASPRSRGASARPTRPPRCATPTSASSCAIESTPTGASKNGAGERSPSTSTEMSRCAFPASIRGRRRQRRNASRFARIVCLGARAARDVAERARVELLLAPRAPSRRRRPATRAAAARCRSRSGSSPRRSSRGDPNARGLDRARAHAPGRSAWPEDALRRDVLDLSPREPARADASCFGRVGGSLDVRCAHRAERRAAREGGRESRATRRLADSNRCKRLCRPLPNHSAKAPRGASHRSPRRWLRLDAQ